MYSGGGTEVDPYIISTPAEMNDIGNNPGHFGSYFKLTADIDLGAYTGTSFNIIGPNSTTPFTGVFDGNDHTISNFTYSSTGTDYIGLFGCVDDQDAEIKNLGLIDPNVDAGSGSYVGSLVGRLENGTITACYAEGGPWREAFTSSFGVQPNIDFLDTPVVVDNVVGEIVGV